jgi:hypothetical protein
MTKVIKTTSTGISRILAFPRAYRRSANLPLVRSRSRLFLKLQQNVLGVYS